MSNHFDLSDQDFEQQFESCSLDPSLFNHEAHLRLAWIHVVSYGVEQAAENLCNQIRAFDRIYGDGTKYNKTVTIASAYAVNHFVQKCKGQGFTDLITEFPELIGQFKTLLQSHYSVDIFEDSGAKEDFLEPDLQAF